MPPARPARSLTSRRSVLVGALVLGLSFGRAAQARRGAPPESAVVAGLSPLSAVRILVLPGIDHEELLAEDADRTKPGPFRFAVAQHVHVKPSTDGTWEPVAGKGWIWRLRVVSPGATDLNFGFTHFRLPAGATLHVLSETEDYIEGPYTSADGGPSEQLWTPVLPGDRAVIEIYVPSTTRDDVQLELGQVSHGYRDVFGRGDPAAPKSLACMVDVACSEGNEWRDEIRSVGRLQIGGTAFCSGTLVMDVPRDFRPFFLTANHCGLDASNAPSAVVYWNFQTSACGGPRDGSLLDNQTGATFRAAEVGTDVALIELDALPNPPSNVHFSGWDRSAAVPRGAVGIHHPAADEKAISVNLDAPTTADSCIGTGGINSHWLFDSWNVGATEPGSSGSAIWDPVTHLVVGTLSGGTPPWCSAAENCYGKFSEEWGVGPSPAARLRDWLDPGGSGTMSVPGFDPGPPRPVVSYVSHAGADACSSGGASDANGAWEPGETIQMAVTLAVDWRDLTGGVGRLTTTTPGVRIVDGTATWPDIRVGVPTTSDAPHFSVLLAGSIACYSTVDFRLEVSGAEGGPFVVPFSQRVGVPLLANVPIAIPDQGTGTSVLEVPDDVVLSDVDVHVRIQHTFIGDVSVELVSPAGTSVLLVDRPFAGNCDDQDMDVTFDDASTTDLQGYCGGNRPWYSGRAKPLAPLAALAGERSQGTWQLRVTDGDFDDVGVLLDWLLTTRPALSAGTCVACAGPCGQEIGWAGQPLTVAKGPAGSVVLTLPPVASTCAQGVQVRMSSRARPAAVPGSFPDDPTFTDVTAQDVDAGPAFRHVPPPGAVFYLAVESLPGGAPGPSGSYGS